MKYTFLIIVLLMLVSCSQEAPEQITDIRDYDVYLSSAESKKTSKYFEQWNSMIKPDSMQLMSFGIVAGEYSRYFQETGKRLLKSLRLENPAITGHWPVTTFHNTGSRRHWSWPNYPGIWAVGLESRRNYFLTSIWN